MFDTSKEPPLNHPNVYATIAVVVEAFKTCFLNQPVVFFAFSQKKIFLFYLTNVIKDHCKDVVFAFCHDSAVMHSYVKEISAFVFINYLYSLHDLHNLFHF